MSKYRHLTEADESALLLLRHQLGRQGTATLSSHVQLPEEMCKRLIDEALSHRSECMTSDDVLKTIRQIAASSREIPPASK